MKRFIVVSLAAVGAIALLSGTPVGAADDPLVNEKPAGVGPNLVDADGDGVCDNCTGVGPGPGQGQKARAGNRGHGPRDGSGRQVGPRDGSGRPGAGDSGGQMGPRNRSGRGAGGCDGTGPKGQRGGRRGGGRR